MPSSSEPPVGSSAELPPTAQEGRGVDGAPRDTVPTGPLPHSTLPPERPEPPESAPADSDFAPVSVPLSPPTAQPTSEAPGASRSHANDDRDSSGAENNTLHSASQPASGGIAHWDERRIVHLEHEFDQLSARQRLLDKRLEEHSLRLRWFLALGLIAAVLSALWSWARG